MSSSRKDSVPIIMSGLVESISTASLSRFFMTLRQLTFITFRGLDAGLAFGFRVDLLFGVEQFWGVKGEVSDVVVESRQV